MTHISEIDHKSAARLASGALTTEFPSGRPDDYAITIVRAAQVLVNKNMGGFEYQTQWTSGATLWRFRDETVVVKTDGSVS